MKDYLDKYKSNISIIILIFYSLGYVYLDRYYNRFNISIENYINLTDIIFVTVKILVGLTLLYLVIEIILLIISRLFLKIFYSKPFNYKIKGRVNNIKKYDRYYVSVIKRQIERKTNEVSFFVFLITPFILSHVIDEKVIIFTLFFPFFIFKIYQICHYENDKERNRMLEFFLVALCIILFISFGIWGHIDGNYKKTTKNTSIIKFNENKKLYNTDLDSLNYIGETSSYLFIYDKKNRNSLIFNKGSISNFKIKDITLTQKEKELITKETEIKIDSFLNIEH